MFVMVKSNLDDFAGPEQSFFAHAVRFANLLIYKSSLPLRQPRSLSHSGAPADIILASREGNVPRLREDIENAGNG